jgi:hypothetical protein
MDLWLLQHQLQLITPDTATPKAINCCMQMLESCAKRASALALEGHDVSGFEAACADARRQGEAVAGVRALQVAEKYQLPPAEELVGESEQLGRWRLPKGVVPPAYEVHEEGQGLAAARRRAEKNLGSLGVMEEGKPLGEALRLLLQLLKQQPGGREGAGAIAGGDVPVLLALRAVEQQLFSRALVGFTQASSKLTGEEEVKLLEDVVYAYRKVSVDFISSKASQAFLKVEQRSRELLVVWVAYCMTFEATRTMYPLAAQYGVAPDFKDLQRLVLSDRAAADAALAVAEYLRQHQKSGLDLFSLKDQGAATFQFAEAFARGSWAMMDTWQQETYDAGQRVEKHWQEVQRKQRLAADLRSKLSTLRQEYSRLCSERDRLYVPHKPSYEQSSVYSVAKNRATNKQNEISSTESKLRAAEQAPAPVIQPLPKEERRALQWIFFLYMPPVLRCLSRGSFLAQQMLLPLPDYPSEVAASTSVRSFSTSMSVHYTSYQKCSYHSPSSSRLGTEGQVMFRSYEVAPQANAIGRYWLGHVSG